MSSFSELKVEKYTQRTLAPSFAKYPLLFYFWNFVRGSENVIYLSKNQICKTASVVSCLACLPQVQVERNTIKLVFVGFPGNTQH
jgi:hypothetical protein